MSLRIAFPATLVFSQRYKIPPGCAPSALRNLGASCLPALSLFLSAACKLFGTLSKPKCFFIKNIQALCEKYGVASSGTGTLSFTPTKAAKRSSRLTLGTDSPPFQNRVSSFDFRVSEVQTFRRLDVQTFGRRSVSRTAFRGGRIQSDFLL
jgi:hypothetical protein